MVWGKRLCVSIGLRHGSPHTCIGSQNQCKFGVVQCKITSQNVPAGLDMPLKRSPNYIYQLTTTNSLHQTVTQMLAQPLCGYSCLIYTCAVPMCCYGMCVQGLHSTKHLQHPIQELAIRVTTLTLTCSQNQCKFRVIQCKIISQNGPAGLDLPLRGSPNYVYQLTTTNSLHQIVTQTLAQLLCGYSCVIYTCAAPMCCYGMCVQGLHSTKHLQHPIQELAIRVTTLTLTCSQNQCKF